MTQNSLLSSTSFKKDWYILEWPTKPCHQFAAPSNIFHIFFCVNNIDGYSFFRNYFWRCLHSSGASFQFDSQYWPFSYGKRGHIPKKLTQSMKPELCVTLEHFHPQTTTTTKCLWYNEIFKWRTKRVVCQRNSPSLWAGDEGRPLKHH